MKKILAVILFVTMSCNFLNAQTIEEVSSFYNARKFAKAEKAAENLISLGVEDARLFMLLGRTLADQQKTALAIPYLERSLKIGDAPSWVYAWSNSYLGGCYYKIGEYEKAKEAAIRCIDLNATQNSLRSAKYILSNLGMGDNYKAWTIIETNNFRFHFQDTTQFSSSIYFVLKREAALETIRKEFPCTLPKKIDYFVWSDLKESEEVLKRSLGFSLPEYTAIHSRINQTAGHELTHVVTYYSLQLESNSRLVSEGVSVYFDQSGKDKMAMAKKAVANYDKVFDFIDVWSKGEAYPESLVYPVGGAWIMFAYENFKKDELDLLLKHQAYNTLKDKMGDTLDNYIMAFVNAISQ